MSRSTIPCQLVGCCLLLAACAMGCNSPYHADRGALLGGTIGAVTGAIVGNAVSDNPLAGAAIGGIAGAAVGGVTGDAMDQMEERNRRRIESQMGYQIRAGAVTVQDVLTMTQASVADELIVNHVRGNGMVAPLTTNDIIVLQQQGVSSNVISEMQRPPVARTSAPVAVVRQPRPIIIQEHCDPYHHYPYRHVYHHHPRHHSSIHFGFGGHH